jgi:SAM-dependent methyltransferase
MTPDDAIPKTLAGIRDLYAGNLAEHGLSSRSVGWKDDWSHLLRFERLSRIIDRDGGDYTVNDWGCGYGAMFAYLDALPGARLREYIGYDLSPEMIDAAKAQCDPARSRFVLGPEVTAPADYSFVSGTFNVKLQASDEEWDVYVKRQLSVIYAHSRKGIAFNLLTSYVDWKAENLFYADPNNFFDFCKRHLSRHVTLVHDYALFEWTLLVSRDPRP